MQLKTTGYRAIIAALAATLIACSPAEDPGLFPEYSAATAKPIPQKKASDYNADKNLYWGDLHIHTGYSTDAYISGVRATPDDAYTFVRGGEIRHVAGYGIKLKRPLDFAAVTDHSEYLGVMLATSPDLPLNRRGLRDRLLTDSALQNSWMQLQSMWGFDLENAMIPGWETITASAWEEIVAAAQRHNFPGRFTSFVGYEWTSMPGERNLHRNVIYRGTAVPKLPYSSVDSEDPRDLWSALDRQRQAGMDNFAIPHNGNVSDGLMYAQVMFDGQAMHANYAETRMRNEPISEIFQVKGSSETHPLLSDEDDFAGFEIYDTLLGASQADVKPKGGYARDALRTGIEMSHREGFNPYRFGVIGSSDGHNASSPAEEDSYHGKLPLMDGSAGIRMRQSLWLPEGMPGGERWSAAGLAAVWAEENTRGAIFDAMRRKETFATSGPRIAVRFFGGWDYAENLIDDDQWIEKARAGGVAMGSDLPQRTGTAPRFALWAIRDPDSGNLDRLQVIKGWLDSDGDSHEQVFNVAWSGDRKLDAQGELRAVGNTVNAAQASYQNTIGSDQLATVWTDPDFNPDREAFYYARVIEIPTPRWTTFDRKTLGMEPPERASLQERAVTSAIWYSP